MRGGPSPMDTPCLRPTRILRHAPTSPSTTCRPYRCWVRSKAAHWPGIRPTAWSPGDGCRCCCRSSEELDFVYTLDVHSGFPFTAVDANQTVVGLAGGQRFPEYVSFSPAGMAVHLRGSYFGLRGVLENATSSSDPYVVNNNVDSPAYGTFTEPLGRPSPRAFA